jgi:hypothetical protein
LRKFIEETVLCGSCYLPEMTLGVRAKEQIWSVCSACGFTAQIRLSNAKFAKFVLSHPPAIAGTTVIRNGNRQQVASSQEAGGRQRCASAAELCSNSSLERELVALELAARKEKQKAASTLEEDDE